jgi:steroid delta-isomerase-like uncharacterized protein
MTRSRFMVTLLGTALLLAVALVHSRPSDPGSANAALARKVFLEIYTAGHTDLVDQLYADDFVDDSPGGGRGHELIKQAVVDFHQACPDLHFEIEDVFSTGDKVVIRYVALGTQTGPYGRIPPTGKSIRVRGITIFQVVNGRIKTEWTEYDRLGMLRQIAVFPS